MITVAVEGDTDVPFVSRLCEAAGFEVRAPIIDARGKHALDERIAGFARAGKGSPHLLVRDLDQDARCAVEWLSRTLPKERGEFFSLRLAVRAVEAWFLADREHAADCLHVSQSKIPVRPDEEDDPKLTIVSLARQSPKPLLKKLIVPAPGATRKAAPAYAQWLMEAAQGWSFNRAKKNSDSLARAHRALVQLRAAWERSGG